MTAAVRLDICDARLTEVPIVKITVTVQPLERATLEVVDALEKALTLPAKWDAMARYVKGVVQIGGAIAEVSVFSLWRVACCFLTRVQRSVL